MDIVLRLPDDLESKMFAAVKDALTGWNSPARSVISNFTQDLVIEMLQDPDVKQEIQNRILLEFRNEAVLKQVIKNLIDAG